MKSELSFLHVEALRMENVEALFFKSFFSVQFWLNESQQVTEIYRHYSPVDRLGRFASSQQYVPCVAALEAAGFRRQPRTHAKARAEVVSNESVQASKWQKKVRPPSVADNHHVHYLHDIEIKQWRANLFGSLERSEVSRVGIVGLLGVL